MGYRFAFHLIIHKGDNQLVFKQKWYTETERIKSHEVNVHLKVNWYEYEYTNNSLETVGWTCIHTEPYNLDDGPAYSKGSFLFIEQP